MSQLPTIQTNIQLAGLTCGACQKVTQKYIGKIDGVQDVHVDLQTGVATITADRTISTEEVMKALEGTHYQVA